jgi:hypothetical protein
MTRQTVISLTACARPVARIEHICNIHILAPKETSR